MKKLNWKELREDGNSKEILSIDDIPKGAIGFVYYIELDNGMAYIGKKNLFSERKKHFGKKKLATITDKRLKTYEIVKKESNWKTYTGSNKDLNKDLKMGQKVIDKVILRFAFSKKELTYLEAKALFVFDVLENDDYYNDNILGKFFKQKNDE